MQADATHAIIAPHDTCSYGSAPMHSSLDLILECPPNFTAVHLHTLHSSDLHCQTLVLRVMCDDSLLFFVSSAHHVMHAGMWVVPYILGCSAVMCMCRTAGRSITATARSLHPGHGFRATLRILSRYHCNTQAVLTLLDPKLG